MPIYIPQTGEKREKTVRQGPVWQFWRNLAEDARELGPAMVLGPLMLGHGLALDVGKTLTGDPRFSKTTGNIGGMVEGFRETSPLISLAQGKPGEAWDRWYERPLTGSLDFAAGAGLVTSAGAKASRGMARMAPTSASRKGWMDRAGFEFIGKKGEVKDVRAIPDSSKYRFGPGEIIGDDVFARPTHRRVLPSKDSPLLLDDPRDYWDTGRSRFHDIDDISKAPESVRKRIKHIDAWSRVSRNPMWRQLNEELAGVRRNIPHDKLFSSDRQLMRKIRRGAEKSGFIAFGSAKALHEKNNTQLANDIAEMLKNEKLNPAVIEELVDYGSYLSAAGYSNIAHRIADIEGLHRGVVPIDRIKRAELRIQHASKEADSLRQQIDRMRADGIDMSDARAVDLASDLHKVNRGIARQRNIIDDTERFIKQKEKERKGISDPSSGFAHEMKQIEKLGASRLEAVMRSPAMERWLDDLELAADQIESLAMTNYGKRGLSAEEAVTNRFRMAELYQIGGATDANRRKYMRTRQDGTVRTPVFIPMMGVKEGAVPITVGKKNNPFWELPDELIGDPSNLEMWGSNLRKPVTGGLFFRKHANEIHDYHKRKIMDNARGMGWKMNKAQAEQFADQYKHEGLGTMTRAGIDGKPHDMTAPFIDVGEFATKIDEAMATVKMLEDDFRIQGLEEAANKTEWYRKNIAGALGETEGMYRIRGDKSVSQVARVDDVRGGMTTILPSPVYSSIVDDLIKTAHVVNEIATAPYARAAVKKTIKTTMQVWKYSILHLRPKWMFNNALGSIYMLAMQEGWFPALAKTIRNTPIFRWAMDFLGVDKKKLERGGSQYLSRAVEKKMSDVLYASGSTTMFGFTDRQLSKLNKVERLFDKIADINAQWADNPARMGRITGLIDEYVDAHIAHQKSLGKKVTKSRDELILETLNDQKVREKIAQTALEDMIDFQDLNGLERQMVAYAVPFWSWLKGSTKATVRHFADQPLRTSFQRYTGAEAQRQVSEQFPQGIPSYLLSSLPGGWTGDKPRDIINVAGASPAQTFGDVLAMFPSFVGGIPQQFGSESPLAMMNPIITGTVAATTYRHPFFGTPIAREELQPNIYWETFQPPLYRSLYRMGVVPKQPWAIRPSGFEPWQPGENVIAEHRPWSYLQRLALPISQTIRPSVAAERYAGEQTELGQP